MFFAALIAEDSTSLVELAQAPGSRSDVGAASDSTREQDFVGTLMELLDSGIGVREKDVLVLVGAGVGDVELKRVGVGRTEKASVSLASVSHLSQKSKSLFFFNS